MLTMRQKNDQRESRQKRLDDIKNGVVFGKVNQQQKVMVNWFLNTYLPMPEWEKQEVKDSWDRYYQICAQSTEANLFREIKDAAKTDNTKRFSELLSQAREMIQKGFVKIPEPSGYDPDIWESSQWANDYRILNHILKDDESFEQVTSTGNDTW